MKKKRRKKTPRQKIMQELKDLWRQEVLERDGRRDVVSGEVASEGKPLHVHHCVVNAGRCLRTRFLVDNGVTLSYVSHIIKLHDEGDAETYDKMKTYMVRVIGEHRWEEIKHMKHSPDPVSMDELREWREAFLARRAACASVV